MPYVLQQEYCRALAFETILSLGCRAVAREKQLLSPSLGYEMLRTILEGMSEGTVDFPSISSLVWPPLPFVLRQNQFK